MGLIKKIKTYLKNKKVNKLISQYKYAHIMFNDKFNKPFVDFLNRNFDKNEHVVLCKRGFKEHPFPEGENVIEITSLKGLKFNKSEKIICHSLFDPELVDYLYKHQDILRNKSYWVIWGGDLYNAQQDEKNDFVRKNFKGYISSIGGDEFVAAKKYNSSAVLKNALYKGQITEDPNFLKTINKEEKNCIRIQINNSADKTTLDMLDILSKFKDENIKITTILSYGQMQYKDEIIQKGREIFAEKFEYVDTYMQPEDYSYHMGQNDILILNQDRQQGMGNALMTLCLGGKLFIKSDITSYKFLSDNGMRIFDTYSISDLSFDDFVSYPQDICEKNKQNASFFLSDEYIAGRWKEAIGV